MKIISVKLKSIFITAAVLLAVTAGVFFMASLMNEAVAGNEMQIPFYDVNKNTNEISVASQNTEYRIFSVTK